MPITHMTLLLALIALLSPAGLLAAEAPEELYRQQLDGGRALRVLHIRNVADWSELQPVFTAQMLAERVGELRVVLDTGQGKELLLASRPLIEMADPQSNRSGAAVMHCQVRPNQVVIVFGVGPYLGAWRIQRDGQIIGSEIAWFHRWAVGAVMKQLTQDSVLVRSQQNQQGRWTFEVAERPGGSTEPRYTTFVQEDDRWEFRTSDKSPVR